MKRLTLFYLLIAFSTTFNLKAQDRTMMNIVWQQTFGEPSEIEWTASTLDHNGDLLTTGHAKNAQGNAELLLNKTNPEGAVIWTVHTPQPAAVKRTFGTAISTNSSGDIFAAGVRSSDGTDDMNNYFVVKSASDGTTLWSQELDGSGNGNDIPTAITNDNSGNVYVTGLSLGDGSELDFYTLKLNGTNGEILWKKRYDRYNLYDVPVSIDLDAVGNVIVIGASAKNLAKWEIVALKYAANGTLLTESIIENETLAFEKPSAFAKDDNGNIFITGITTQDGSDFDMKTVKLDSDLNLLWKEKFDYHKIDSTSAITVDAAGNAIVTGWSSNESGGTEFMTVKYSPTGDLLWSKRRTTDRSAAKAKAFAVQTDAEGNIIITGEIDYGAKSTALVVQYSPEGKTMWERKLAPEDYEKHRPNTTLLNDEGDIFVTGIGKQTTNRSYSSFKITRKRRELIPATDELGKNLYVKNEIIIRMEPEHLNIDFVDNTALRYGRVSDIIGNPEAIAAIDEELGADGDFSNWCMIKVHRIYTSQTGTLTLVRVRK